MDDVTKSYPREPERVEDQQFSEQAVAWLLSLDKAYFPAELAKAMPRIINRLAATWDYPSESGKYLNSLLLDDRVGRRGFPIPILRELISLKELCGKTEPDKTDIWEKAHLIRHKPGK